MKKIWGYITTHYREECNKKYLLLAMLFSAIMLFINYRYDFEYTYIKPDFNWWSRVGKYVGLYGLAFGGAYLLQIIADPKDTSLRSGKVWGLILFAVVLFSVRAAFFQQSYLVNKYVPFALQTVMYKCVANLVGFTFLFIPCAVYWFFLDRKTGAQWIQPKGANEWSIFKSQGQPLYGFHAKGVDLKPYFILIAMMVPLLLWAGHQPDFLTVYPRAAFLNMPAQQPFRKAYTFLYEVCYSSDYVVTEFFFRGFLILAFARFIGYKAIIPMCVFYVTIHFDKPLGEAISSFFGGYLLGLLVYKTRSIYGGVIVHLGIALLMEAIGLMFHPAF